MSKSLQNIIGRYKNGLLTTQNLQIRNEIFSNEIISDECLSSSTFTNVSLSNLNFTNIRFDSSSFQKCLFENCEFDSIVLQNARFENCRLTNCQLRNCNLIRVDFTETIFDRCQFEKADEGSLVKAWFESCHFLDTHFDGFEGAPLIQTAVIDSKFSKFKKSIDFQGEFFLIDILQPVSGISGMFLE